MRAPAHDIDRRLHPATDARRDDAYSDLHLDDETEIDLTPPVHEASPTPEPPHPAPPPPPPEPPSRKLIAPGPICARSAPIQARKASPPPAARAPLPPPKEEGLNVKPPTGQHFPQPLGKLGDQAESVSAEPALDFEANRAVPTAPLWTGAAPSSSETPPLAGRPSLKDLFPDNPQPKRQLPSRLRILLAGLGVLLLAVIVLGNRGQRRPPVEAISSIDDSMIVSADELKNRREVRPEDFRARDGASASAAPSPAPMRQSPQASPVTDAASTSDGLADRRARRRQDPDDVMTVKQRRSAKASSRSPSPSIEDETPVYVTAPPPPAAPPTDPQPGSQSARVAAAGISIGAVLVNGLLFPGASPTVVAIVDKQAPVLRGVRFIGTASSTGGRVTIRFRSVIFADGRQARVDAEAQDDDGTFGVAAHASDGERASDDGNDGSVLRDVAQDTATDLVTDAVGVGVAGRAIDRYVSGSRSHRPSLASQRISLAAGTHFHIFLHEAITASP